ncbi:hypothetical protein EV697_101439 [Bisgaardia hudsonensis]|uniref:Uncharacterized protein n=1 Tax=Bisgaardia hudsonensis TaxID=109472 RepID=A0A4R2N393_9PAST|nr:hypothetical protein [Bisgaardia hudsonensis]QLB12748.1 hypothetical protein A6A11_03565 [Bisgaardia hudsonensis]TCP14299.1 hypothetical protein EV697_101439 [Bisgaardia hudsonensis]
MDDLFSQIRSGQKISVNTLKNNDIKIYSEKNVIAVYVRKADQTDIPVHINGNITQAYARFNSGDHKLNNIELKNLISSYNDINKDSKVIRNTGINEINSTTLAKYKQYLKVSSPASQNLVLSDLDFLKNIGAYSKNFNDNYEGLTYSGLLMFGKLETIRVFLPNYFLSYQVIENDERYSERITVDDLDDGNLFEFFLNIL